nr:zinc metalloprotease [Chitinophagaceae bacterium]
MIFWQTSIQAQEATVRECGTTEYMNALEHAHPEVAQQRQLIEQHTQQFIRSNHKKSRSIITIPVVVHVVYNLAVQNISDAQIQSQIAVLNKDFRKLNTDFLNTPGSFQPLAADCQIEFVLAKRDPNGDSTTGITRTATLTTSFTNNNNVKSSATGGKDAWPATAYLNIWVCKLSGGLIGYGQFPGGPAATDGVVISYKAFGTMGAALPPFNKGRTATHEIGHWLNLYHIWGDDAGSCNGTDVVEDTPNQGNSNTGVPVYPKISCNNAPFGDMFMNYMDYTDDIAMTMFSVGQKAR